MKNKNLYFAYGSNLDEKQMEERCPDSKLLGMAVLKNYRLDFTIYSPSRKYGCADVVRDEGKEVWGLLYDLSEEDLQKLDKFEGDPNFYRRIQVDVMNEMDESFKVYTYEERRKEKIKNLFIPLFPLKIRFALRPATRVCFKATARWFLVGG